MTKIPHILEKVYFEPWLITSGGYATVIQVIDSKLADSLTVEMMAEGLPAQEVPPEWVTASMDRDGIATIPIQGVLGHRISGIEKICGGTDYLDIRRATEKALAQNAQGILYAIDSSGGMVRGCSDLANYIKGLPIPTQAFTDSKADSAAYWLASACNRITATESSNVGSIGCILPWVDRSKVWEVEGLKFDAITNSGADLKASGAGPTLSPEQRAYLQSSVDFVGEQFQNFVSSSRKVKPIVFRAGSYFGKPAKEVGLIDEVGDYESAKKDLLIRCQNKLVPGPVSKPKIQGKSMTLDELKAQHPELYASLLQDQQNAVTAATNAATAAAQEAERARLSALDALNYNSACAAIVTAAKSDPKKTAAGVALEIAAVLGKENEILKAHNAVLKGGKTVADIVSVDPFENEENKDEKKLTARLKSVFAKNFGTIESKGGRN